MQGHNRHPAGGSQVSSSGSYSNAAATTTAAAAVAAAADVAAATSGSRRAGGSGVIGAGIGVRGLGIGLGLGNQQHGRFTDDERRAVKDHLKKAADGFIQAIMLGRKKWSALVQQVRPGRRCCDRWGRRFFFTRGICRNGGTSEVCVKRTTFLPPFRWKFGGSRATTGVVTVFYLFFWQ